MTPMKPPAATAGPAALAALRLCHALTAGSRVLTATGLRPVEELAAGDRVVTRDRGMAVLRDIRRATLTPGTPMVLVPEGALGRERPEREVLLLPDQPVALRDWRARTLFGAREARVAAARLVDGRIIRLAPAPATETVALVLDWPAALFVDGLELVCAAAGAIPPR